MKKLLVIILGAVIAALLLTCIGCTKPKQALKQAPITTNITSSKVDRSKIYKIWRMYKYGIDTMISAPPRTAEYQHNNVAYYNDGTGISKGYWKWVNDTVITDSLDVDVRSRKFITLLNDTALQYYTLDSYSKPNYKYYFIPN